MSEANSMSHLPEKMQDGYEYADKEVRRTETMNAESGMLVVIEERNVVWKATKELGEVTAMTVYQVVPMGLFVLKCHSVHGQQGYVWNVTPEKARALLDDYADEVGKMALAKANLSKLEHLPLQELFLPVEDRVGNEELKKKIAMAKVLKGALI